MVIWILDCFEQSDYSKIFYKMHLGEKAQKEGACYFLIAFDCYKLT